MYQIQNLSQFQQSFSQVKMVVWQIEQEAARRAKLTRHSPLLLELHLAHWGKLIALHGSTPHCCPRSKYNE